VARRAGGGVASAGVARRVVALPADAGLPPPGGDKPTALARRRQQQNRYPSVVAGSPSGSLRVDFVNSWDRTVVQSWLWDP